MSDIAVRCEGLSKRYRIGEREPYRALRDIITDGVASPFRRFGQRAKRNGQSPADLSLRAQHSPLTNTFWALDDVSFEVKRGDVLGIIGRNGAGKSTLLKILSRITMPTRGHAEIHGRVASLLEVGTGFHPELTGRENIYLNAAIMGMRKAEVERKFDEIVAFAEVEKFIDTPVKRYSSGMYVRLAFAVAAHLEPEILVIDEVLAVGDAAFQKKCLGRMGEVARAGRTVLFVSHNMEAILRLCNKAILLDEGSVVGNDAAGVTVANYLKTGVSQAETVDLQVLQRTLPVRGQIRLKAASMSTSKSHTSWKLPFGEDISFEVEVEAMSEVEGTELGVALMSGRGFELASCLSSRGLPKSKMGAGLYKYKVEYQSLRLVPGLYRFGLGIRSSFGLEDYLADAFELEIIPSESSSLLNVDTFQGAVVPDVSFGLFPLN